MANVSLIDGHLDNAEHCVCCGQVIPEGRQVCIICGKKVNGKQRQIDRIRNMSVEELAESLTSRIMCSCCPCTQLCNKYKNVSCVDIFKIWLEQEVEE
jgi:predicted nucleic acid-binding Zn ribbon protein